MRKSRTFRKHTKLHRKKSNVRKSHSFKKRRNAMRGGNFDELITFLKTHEKYDLHDHFSKLIGVQRLGPAYIFNEFKLKKISESDLLNKLTDRMETDQQSIKVFTPTPPPTPPTTYYDRDYKEALFMANHNIQNNNAVWEELKRFYNVSTPEEYATHIANEHQKKLIKQPTAFVPFQQPPLGTYGGV